MIRYNKFMNTMKKLGLVTFKSALIFVIATLFAVLSMFLAYLIPTEKMLNNATISSEILSTEGNYKELISGDDSSRLDNFTDSIMISEAIYESDGSIIYKAIMNFHNGWGVDGLESQIDGEKIENSYSRYWNGYLIFLKPLLLIFNIKGIRILNIILQTILILGVCVLLFKKAKTLIIPYLFSIFVLNPLAVMQSMQFSSIFYIFNIAMLVLLIFYEKLKAKNYFGYAFLIIGIVTSFFDFLTYPLATLVMPLTIIMWFDESKTYREKFLTAFKFGVFWAIGYFGFWIAKWLVGSLITGENLILGAINQAKFRTTGDVAYEQNKILVRLPFILNTRPIFNLRNAIALCFVFVIFVVAVVAFRKQYKFQLVKSFSFLVIALLPILWYLVLSNHSFVHYWFTFRTYIGTIFAVTALAAYGFKDLKIKRGVSNEKEDSGTSAML